MSRYDDIPREVNNNFSRNRERLKVLSFRIIETGTYRDLYYRPVELTVTNDAKRRVNNALDIAHESNRGRQDFNNSSKFVHSNALKGSVLDFFAPSAQVGDRVQVEEGLDTPRFRWFMEVEWDTSLRSHPIRQFVTGYTDPTDISHGGHIDPRCTFYVNSCFEIRTANFSSSGRENVRQTGVTSDLILSDPSYGTRGRNKMKRMLRPSDVVQSSVIPTDLYGEMESENVFSTVGLLTDNAELSTRAENNPVHYLTSILNSHARSMVGMHAESASEESILSSTIVNSSRGVESNRFLTFIRNARDMDDSHAFFEYRDLLDMIPNIDDIAEVMLRDFDSELGRRDKLNRDMDWMLERSDHRGDTDDLDGSALEDQIIAMVASTVPEIALSTGYGSVAFSVHNKVASRHRGDGRYKWYFHDYRTVFTDADPEEALPQFEVRMEDDVLDNISMNGDIEFELSISVDIFNDIRIDLAIESRGGTRHRRVIYPTFLESLAPPIVTDDSRALGEISSGVRELLGISMDNHTSRLVDSRGRAFDDYDTLDYGNNNFDDPDARDSNEDTLSILDKLEERESKGNPLSFLDKLDL